MSGDTSSDKIIQLLLYSRHFAGRGWGAFDDSEVIRNTYREGFFRVVLSYAGEGTCKCCKEIGSDGNGRLP